MNAEQGGAPSPVRIELASSEIEGGSCQAWIDPGRVLAVLAVSHGADLFRNLVEPRLAENEPVSSLFPTPAGAESGVEPSADARGTGESLPPALHGLLTQLQNVHEFLYQENQASSAPPRWCEVACALAEEDRVYFIRGPRAWICLLRRGRAHPVVSAGDPVGTSGAALGKDLALQCEVTSLAIRPEDALVIISAADPLAPDPGMVERLFAETPDLKRACDGLVGLLGLRSEGMSVAALRFTPVRAGEEVEPRPDLLADLLPTTRPESGRSMDEEIEALLRQAIPVGAQREIGPTADAPPGPDPTSTPTLIEARTEPVGQGPAGEATLTAGPMSKAASRAREAAPSPTGSRPAGRRSDSSRLWALVVLAAILLILGVTALPRAWVAGPIASLFHFGSGGGVRTSGLELAPIPPALRVLVDGEAVSDSTPVRLDRLSDGNHRITLDFGDCGTWEKEVEIHGRSPVLLAPHLTGTLVVSAADTSAGASVWLNGKTQQPVPARFEAVPIGWVQVFFQDSRLPLWECRVLVKPGAETQVSIPNDLAPGAARYDVLSLTPSGGQGLVETPGDSVRIDGRFLGLTPWRGVLEPGWHGLKVSGAGGISYVEAFEARAGSARLVAATLGDGPQVAIEHIAPGRIWVRGPILLSFAVSPSDYGPLEGALLHLPDIDSTLRDIPCSLVDSLRGVYLGIVNSDAVRSGKPVSYYFTGTGPDGGSVSSELYRFVPQFGRAPS